MQSEKISDEQSKANDQENRSEEAPKEAENTPKSVMATPEKEYNTVEEPCFEYQNDYMTYYPQEKMLFPAKTHPKQKAKSPKEAKRRSKQRICSNCQATNTPSWRRGGSAKMLLCNACGLYQKLHGKPRPYNANSEGRNKTVKSAADKASCPCCYTVVPASEMRDTPNGFMCGECTLYYEGVASLEECAGGNMNEFYGYPQPIYDPHYGQGYYDYVPHYGYPHPVDQYGMDPYHSQYYYQQGYDQGYYMPQHYYTRYPQIPYSEEDFKEDGTEIHHSPAIKPEIPHKSTSKKPTQDSRPVESRKNE